MNPVVHFEMSYADADRASRFYQSAFGWQTQSMGPAMGDYVLAITTESGPAGPLEPGRINGGFFPRRAGMPESMTGPSVVIAVDDIAAAMAAVTAAGGTVMGEPMDIPGVGRYVAFLDTEQNRSSMLQPLPRG